MMVNKNLQANIEMTEGYKIAHSEERELEELNRLIVEKEKLKKETKKEYMKKYRAAKYPNSKPRKRQENSPFRFSVNLRMYQDTMVLGNLTKAQADILVAEMNKHVEPGKEYVVKEES